MREAATERDLLRRLAPHLVESVPFALPVTGRQMRVKFGVGLWAYDALASFRSNQIHKHLSAEETESMLPALPEGKITGGFLYYDCKTDDARLVMEVLVAAVRIGAVVANYSPVIGMESSAEGCEATVQDSLSGDIFRVRAKRAVVAGGVWADRIENLLRPEKEDRLRSSKGIHLLFSRADIPMSNAAALIPDAERERMLFVIPWLDSVLVGTTDTEYSGDIDAPAVDDGDRKYVLDALNSVFDLDLNDASIAGAYAGLRPLVKGKEGATADLSRRHAVYDVAPSVIGITGGKLTTWRRMAEDAVNRLAEELDASRGSRTEHIRLGTSDLAALNLALGRRAERLGIPDASVSSLVRSYGNRALSVLDVAEETGLTGPLVPGHPMLAAEAVYTAHSEMAIRLTDLLCRRTRLALTNREAGLGIGSRAAELMAAELDWGYAKTKIEVETHRAAVELERGLSLPLPATG
ncbi:MAG: glycerol-3-phosphate dehydrogenase/oxidase [Actinobacteria bacterium]|nr:glycerol-3-phosphate dehydrogenase/oxidase [Actinomycetota bacterium]